MSKTLPRPSPRNVRRGHTLLLFFVMLRTRNLEYKIQSLQGILLTLTTLPRYRASRAMHPRIYLRTQHLSKVCLFNGLSEIEPSPKLFGEKESNASSDSNDDGLAFRGGGRRRRGGAYLDKFQVTGGNERERGEHVSRPSAGEGGRPRKPLLPFRSVLSSS